MTNETPRYEHVCTTCHFVGRLDEYDLYACYEAARVYKDLSYVVARNGSANKPGNEFHADVNYKDGSHRLVAKESLTAAMLGILMEALARATGETTAAAKLGDALERLEEGAECSTQKT